MTSLYNCRVDGDEWRISKFDSDFNVESSYLTTLTECECPAGSRDTCRHRQMLPRFLARGLSADWFYDFDRGGWVRMALPGASGAIPGGIEDREQTSSPLIEQPATIIPNSRTYALDSPGSVAVPPPLPKGVQMFTLDDPVTLHNAIADAVGEPRIDRRGR